MPDYKPPIAWRIVLGMILSSGCGNVLAYCIVWSIGLGLGFGLPVLSTKKQDIVY